MIQMVSNALNKIYEYIQIYQYILDRGSLLKFLTGNYLLSMETIGTCDEGSKGEDQDHCLQYVL